jgi:hypothetical protein
VKGGADDDWFGDKAMQLILIGNKGKVADLELARYSNRKQVERYHASRLWESTWHENWALDLH